MGGDGGYFGVFTFLYNCAAPGWARDNNSNEIYLKCRHEFFVTPEADGVWLIATETSARMEYFKIKSGIFEQIQELN